MQSASAQPSLSAEQMQALSQLPQLAQAYQAQQQVIQQQQQQIVALQHDVQHLHGPAAAGPGAGPAESAGHGYGMPHRGDDDSHFGLNRLLSKPSVFRGEHGPKVYDWISEFDMLFANCDPHMPEVRKLTFAKQFLREEALRWWTAREKNVQRVQHDPELAALTPAVTTWAEFKKCLEEYFSQRGASELARNELHRMRQRHFRSLADYADHFETTSQRIMVPAGHCIDEELVATFKAGLSDGQIRLFLTNKQPRTLLQACQLALQAESDLRVSDFRGTRSDVRPVGYLRFHAPARGDSQREYRSDRERYGDRSNPKRGPAVYNGSRHVRFTPGSTGYRNGSESGSGAAPMDLGAMGMGGGSQSSESESNEAPDAEPNSARSLPGSDADDDQRTGASSSGQKLVSPTDAGGEGELECPQCGCNVMQQRRGASRSSKSGCWNCGREGHMMRECKQPRRDAKTAAGERSGKGDSTRQAGSHRHF